MRIHPRRVANDIAWVAAAAVAGAFVAALPARAGTAPTAGFGIEPGTAELSVTFVADSTGFPAPVGSYHWIFGDGQSTTTSSRTVNHTYAAASTFVVSVTESDGQGQQATAKGTLTLFRCPAGSGQCSDSLSNVGSVQLLQASGPNSPASPGTLDLLVAPYRIPNCEKAIFPAGDITDAGFTGNLSVTFDYTTHHPALVNTTCFSSTVPFVDAAGRSVLDGPLPPCQSTSATPPCVESISVTGSQVQKTLLIPPGDPKVGGP